MITQSPRTEHIAAHITPEAKRAMYRAASETGKSMSLIVSELIDEYLFNRQRDFKLVKCWKCGGYHNVDCGK